MKTNIYLKNKKITKKHATELIGKETLDRRIRECFECFKEEPDEIHSWMTEYGIIRIEFEA